MADSARAEHDAARLSLAYLPVESLVPYEGNAKLHTAEQVGQICESIRRFGDCDPIGVWHDACGRAVVVEGHGRLMALRELGYEEAPCVILDHLSDSQRRAYALAHNQLTMSTGWDEPALEAELSALAPLEDMAPLGFDLTEAADDPAFSDVEVPSDAPHRCGRGQLWALGEHRLMCGDATEAADVEKLCGGGALRHAAD